MAVKIQQRKEKRLRIKKVNEVSEGKLVINNEIASELEIENKAEIVIGGKKRLIFDVILNSSVPKNQVFINSNEAKLYGIADNTIATVRKPLT